MPLIVTAAPAMPLAGVNPVIVGAPPFVPTVKFELLVAEPLVFATVIGPVPAPDGTDAMICVEVADVTVVAVPLNCTVFCDAVVLKPVPLIVTAVPTGPVRGVNEIIETWLEPYREIESMFPTESYL